MSQSPAILIIVVGLLVGVAPAGAGGQDRMACSAWTGMAWVDQFNSPGLAYDRWGLTTGCRYILPADCDYWWDLGVAARAYYLNDQRIEFTGLEATFGVDGVLRGEIGHRQAGWYGVLYGELFLNQRFDPNVLTDFPLRESYSHNFEIDTLEISQLSVVLARGNVEFELGRFVTPFGRYYGFSTLNNFFDIPFLRREAVLPRETGALFRWSPGIWRTTLALTNGGPQQDTNSSKALVARLGVELQRLSFGGSVKQQDGISSEGQKEFKNHIGVDGMIRITPDILLSAEVIRDEYGLRRPGFLLDNINWGRSLYNRQLNNGLNWPLRGWGYYVNLAGRHTRLDWSLEYGEFFPDPVGDLTHDTPIQRGIGQIYWHLSPLADVFGSVVIENAIEGFEHVPRSKGVAYAGGFQVRF